MFSPIGMPGSKRKKEKTIIYANIEENPNNGLKTHADGLFLFSRQQNSYRNAIER